MGTRAGESAAVTRQRSETRQQKRRRVVAVGLIALTLFGSALVVFVSASGSGRDADAPTAAQVEFVLPGQPPTTMSRERATELAAAGRLPFDPRRKLEDGSLTQTVELNQTKLEARLDALGSGGGLVKVPEKTVSSRLVVPIIQQQFRNNCETAALSMLLASAGVAQDQVVLQEQVAKAEPLDPEIGAGGEEIWGDPNLGFVGRYDGGGPAGGFGVFQGPILDLASRFANPADLTEVKPEAVYRRLLAGHAVMTWIGLSDGPYSTWTSPAGKEVTVNFGEHTVLLTGIAGDRVFVNDPIDGQKKVWTRDEFEAKWDLLGNRAISLRRSESM